MELKFPFIAAYKPIEPIGFDVNKSYFINTISKCFSPRFKHLLISTPLHKKSIRVLKSFDLIDIQFEKVAEDEVRAISGLYKYDLVILFVGIAEPSNKYLPDLITQLIEGRQLEEKLTWVVSPYSVQKICLDYGPKMCTAIKSLTAIIWN